MFPLLPPQANRQVMLESISYDVGRNYRLEVKCYTRWQLCKDHFPLCYIQVISLPYQVKNSSNTASIVFQVPTYCTGFTYHQHCQESRLLNHWPLVFQTHITAIHRRGFPFHSENQHQREHQDIPHHDSWRQWAPSGHRTAPAKALHLCDRPRPYCSHRLTGSLQLL